jgi:predicted metal-dependent enzyme (double-stranded beta helix superfamily)
MTGIGSALRRLRQDVEGRTIRGRESPVFDSEAFVVDCQRAASEADPVSAVAEAVAAAIHDGAAIDAALGTDVKEADTLFSTPELTVQRIVWPGGAASRPHDHRMWAVVGVYAGEEVNRLYQRAPSGLEERVVRAVGSAEVLTLGEDAIHSVENLRRQWTAGLHVYGGDILHDERSAWRPDGVEVSFADNLASARPMWTAMREVAADHERVMSADDRYEALTALREAYSGRRRYLTAEEARRVVADAWGIIT